MIYKWNDFITDDFNLILEKVEEAVGGRLSRDDIDITNTREFEYEMNNVEIYDFIDYFKIMVSEYDIAIQNLYKEQKAIIEHIRKGEYQKADEIMKTVQIMINRFKSGWYKK